MAEFLSLSIQKLLLILKIPSLKRNKNKTGVFSLLSMFDSMYLINGICYKTIKIVLHLYLPLSVSSIRTQVVYFSHFLTTTQYFASSRWLIQVSQTNKTSPQTVILQPRIKRCLFLEDQLCQTQLQSCPTLCDPTDGSLPGSPISGILQARTLEWVAISFSNA